MTTTTDIRNSSLAIPLLSQEERLIQEPVEERQRETWCDSCMSMLLMIMLFFQFGIYFATDSPLVNILSWSAVNISVLLFIITTYIFRYTVQDVYPSISDDVVMVFPEFLIVGTASICYFQHITAAFLFLIVGKLVMAAVVIVLSLYRLYTIYVEEKLDDDDAEATDETDFKSEWIAVIV